MVDLQHMGGPRAAQVVGAHKPLTTQPARSARCSALRSTSRTAQYLRRRLFRLWACRSWRPAPISRARVKVGAANARFMPGQWGQGGGPGSIWKVDSRTGAVSLFTNVGAAANNSGAGLGALAYDPGSHSLYVADRETGLIHHLGVDGSAIGVFDHGVQGRAAQGLPPIALQPRPGLDITSPRSTARNRRHGITRLPERRVFGLAVFEHRLFYAIADPCRSGRSG